MPLWNLLIEGSRNPFADGAVVRAVVVKDMLSLFDVEIVLRTVFVIVFEVVSNEMLDNDCDKDSDVDEDIKMVVDVGLTVLAVLDSDGTLSLDAGSAAGAAGVAEISWIEMATVIPEAGSTTTVAGGAYSV